MAKIRPKIGLFSTKNPTENDKIGFLDNLKCLYDPWNQNYKRYTILEK